MDFGDKKKEIGIQDRNIEVVSKKSQKRMKNGKVVCPDNIQAEVWKHQGEVANYIEFLDHNLLLLVSTSGFSSKSQPKRMTLSCERVQVST